MRKIKLSVILVLLVTFLLPSLCYAGTWKTLYIAKYPAYITTSSYTSSTFESDGNLILDIRAYSTFSSNTGTLEVQRLTTSGTWQTAKSYSKGLFVNGYTAFTDSFTCTRTCRIKFTSDSNVRLDGKVEYFTE